MNAPLRPPAIFTDDEFEAFARAAAFAKIGRLELRDGVIVRKSPVFLRHSFAVRELMAALIDAVRKCDTSLEVNPEISIRFGGGFQPTADIAVWEPSGEEGDGPIPGALVKLVVEVADASLGDDLGDKLQSYARAGVPEYWVADVKSRMVFLHAGPGDEGFAQRKTAPFGAGVAALTLAGLIADTAALAG